MSDITEYHTAQCIEPVSLHGCEASYQCFPVAKDTALSVLLVPSSSLMGASLLAVQLEGAEHAAGNLGDGH